MFSFSVEISRVRFGIFCVSGIILGYCYRISIQKYFKCNNRKEVDRSNIKEFKSVQKIVGRLGAE